MSGANRRGQSALETAAAVGAIVVILVGSLKVWGWMNQMLVERQESFQENRRLAGTFTPVDPIPLEHPETFAFGLPLQYEPPPLEIFGLGAEREKKDLIPGIPPPDCRAGQPTYEEAIRKAEEGEQKMQAAEDKRQEAFDTYGQQLAITGSAYDAFCRGVGNEPPPDGTPQGPSDVRCDMKYTVEIEGMDDAFGGPVLDKDYQRKCESMGLSPLVATCITMQELMEFLDPKVEAMYAAARRLAEDAEQLFVEARALQDEAHQMCQEGGL